MAYKTAKRSEYVDALLKSEEISAKDRKILLKKICIGSVLINKPEIV